MNQPINVKAKSFHPTEFNPSLLGSIPAILQQYVHNPQHIVWQKAIDQKVEEARVNKQFRLRFEDLIEDNNLDQPSQNVID